MLIHRFYNELTELETNHIFCGEEVAGHYNILVIGTFNPSNESFPVNTNNAQWFYGRTEKNKFWYYFPQSLTGGSLHPKDGEQNIPTVWRTYCLQNRVIIIDLLKTIDQAPVLTNQKDRELDIRIHENLDNVSYFDVAAAFTGITFNKVIYSLAWSDERNLPKLVRIRDIVNNQLRAQGSINIPAQVIYCKAPWRNDSYDSWNNGINS